MFEFFTNGILHHMGQPVENIHKSLVSNVKRLRVEKGYSQELLAEKADISVFAVQSIESGRRWPEMKTLRAIAKALTVTVDYLVTLHNDEKNITTMQAISVIRLKLLSLEELERVPDDILEMLKHLKTDDFDIIRVFLEKITLNYKKDHSEATKKQRA